MKEKIELDIEKKLFEELMQKYLAQLETEQRNALEAKGTDHNIVFKQVGENRHRPFNPKTGRFHNIELGIDEVM